MGAVYSIRCIKCGELITKHNHSTRSCRLHEDIYERDNLDHCGDCLTNTHKCNINCYHRTFNIKKKKKNKFGSMSL